MDKRHTEYLFELLDDKYSKIYKDARFWEDLHAIDRELTPGCIRIEAFDSSKAATRFSEEVFSDGENTVVMQLQTQKAAEDAAHALNMFFKRTGIWFILENVEKNGELVPQLRSNIDKQQWEKLAVFCKYRFSREIPQDDREALQAECQQAVDVCTKDTTITKNKGWQATEGMPAFCSLMGQHGLLRPEGTYKTDVHRKRKEMNPPHLDGTPLLFRDIHIHVDIDKHGAINTTPYIIGFNPSAEALADSVEGGSLFEIVKEAMGTNFYSPHLRMANRFLRGAVAVLSIVALIEGKLEPVIIATAGVAGLVVGYVHNKWRIIGKLNELEKNYKPLMDALNGKHLLPANDADPKIQEIQARAFSPQGMSELDNLLLEAGVIQSLSELSPKRTDDILATRLGGMMGALSRR